MSNWDTSIRRFAESQKNNEYIEICNCHNPERFLRFDVNSQKYYGAEGCCVDFLCARLQINKHKIVIFTKKHRLVNPQMLLKKRDNRIIKSPSDQTLDQFFKP